MYINLTINWRAAVVKGKGKNKGNGAINLGYYAVAFFDLLGQQDRLRNFRSLPNPNSPAEVDAARQTLPETYGAVTDMRKFFTNAFKSFSGARQKLDTSKLTPEQRKLFGQLTNNPIKTQQFSDSIVVYMSLRSSETAKLPTRGIYGILGGAATTFMACLSKGHPIRGGIDVGIAFEPTSGNEIYGPALSRAYALESRIANYPRIVIGEELVKFLESMRDHPPEDVLPAV